MKVPGLHLKKLDNRSKSVVYLGKKPGTKAYCMYDLNAGTMHVSRDVDLEEGNSC